MFVKKGFEDRLCKYNLSDKYIMKKMAIAIPPWLTKNKIISSLISAITGGAIGAGSTSYIMSGPSALEKLLDPTLSNASNVTLTSTKGSPNILVSLTTPGTSGLMDMSKLNPRNLEVISAIGSPTSIKANLNYKDLLNL